MREFVDEIAVLSRWLGRDVTADLGGALPGWNVFGFRDAVVFEPDAADGPRTMFLVRGEIVREFVVSQESIDSVYAELTGPVLPSAA